MAEVGCVAEGRVEMAERARAKAKRPATTHRRRTEGRTASTAQTADHSAQRIKTLERESERLKAALAEAEERIARLEANRAETVDRIDWVLDSLHNVLESSA